MPTVRVHTTQNVTLEYEVASLGERIVATLIDSLILFAWIIAWVLVVTGLEIKNDVAIGIIVFLVAMPYLFYHLLCEIFFNGQSLGKKSRHIKVMRLDGTAPRLGDYLLRWLLRLVDLQFAGLVAMVTIAANGKGQRLGDLAAGTTVVSVRPRPQQATPLAVDFGTLAGYQPVFPQAAQLADHDVATIRQLLHEATSRENYLLLNEVANKVKALTGIQTDLPDAAFLHTILRDHAHFSFNN